MLKDNEIMKAVGRIMQRAERQADLQRVLATFVDVGVLAQLNNRNNQIMYGRRGTGKTHVFKVLEAALSQEPDTAVCYIDARILGSSKQFSDHTVPLQKRCLSLFRDILLVVYYALLEYIVETEQSEQTLVALDRLQEVITEPSQHFIEKSVSTSVSSAKGSKSGAEGRIEMRGRGSLGASRTSESSSAKKVDTTYSVETEDKIHFPDLSHELSEVLRRANSHFYILFDEWASLPQDVQPFLAEFLKRGVLPVTDATLKIASLEYRSQFSIREQESSLIGFELGADIAASLDLDDYYVFDRNPEFISDTYADILLKHLQIELPNSYLKENYSISTPQDLASKMFTQRRTFIELSRAAEGVIRDLMNIFSGSFFASVRRGRDSIDREAITQAAQAWFEQDKTDQLDQELEQVLNVIVDEVIGEKKARSFMVPRNLEKHPTIQRLFDARVLHVVRRGYADKDNPGVRYNIYTLDYGTYVDLIGTSKAPQLNLFNDSEGIDPKEIMVPFDDKRSIRRIILTEEHLNPI